MIVTAATRKSRLQAEYEAMCALPFNSLFTWKIGPGQTPPYVTKYIVTYNNPTIVKIGHMVRRQEKTIIQIEINPETLPGGAPVARVIDGQVPFHPNWYASGNLCSGNIWNTNMWIWEYAIKIGRVLAFDPAVTNPGSAANGEAATYWHLHARSFPCGRTDFPHPKGY